MMEGLKTKLCLLILITMTIPQTKSLPIDENSSSTYYYYYYYSTPVTASDDNDYHYYYSSNYPYTEHHTKTTEVDYSYYDYDFYSTEEP